MTDRTATLSQEMAAWVDRLRFEAIPADVADLARHAILDAVGIAFASTSFDFSRRTLAALSSLDAGNHPVIGLPQRLTARDATLLNGVLAHGLDYDDTHPGGVVHATVSSLPVALAAATLAGGSGRDLLTGYVAAFEISTRVAMAAKGGMHNVGFHPTGVAGTFGAAAAAAKLAGLGADGIATALGIAGSQAAGLLEFLENGAWTKRLHPGFAAANGLTAAALARQGFEAPLTVFEGRYGLYATHLGGQAPDLDLCTRGLGEQWEIRRNAIKPYPACHMTHAFADAVLHLARTAGLRAADVAGIRCLIHPTMGAVVSYPAEAKRVPRSEYDAKFSLPYVVATSLVRGRFGLAELDDRTRQDPTILDLAARVSSEDDPTSAFPDYFTGEVIVTTRDGRRLRHREQVNRGADVRPLAPAEIVAKFRENMAVVASDAVTARVENAVLGLDRHVTAAGLAELLRGA